jgi:UDP-N-acetylglucosamine 2-epimerase (non-hydrolysing)
MTIRIDLIAGARPNFMKIAPIIRAIERRERIGGPLRYRIVHTGQHYDARLSGQFFEELGIPTPDVNLEAGSGSQAVQTAAILTRYEALIEKEPTDFCLVVGDVNSTLACTITARKLGVPVGHVEAGIRSGDWSMPEEINRTVTDAIANWFFTTSQQAGLNLIHNGVDPARIFFVGNTMIDTLLTHMDRLRPPSFWDELDLAPGEYFVMTLHRPANVDEARVLTETLAAVAEAARGYPVIFPIHPRTRKTIDQVAEYPCSIHLVDPQPYLAFNFLVKYAKAVLTDSGGITEEATVMGIPCLTLRDQTERPETVTLGTNEVIGTDPRKLALALDRIFAGQWKKGGIPEKWDGHAAERIVDALERIVTGACR